MKPDSKKVRLAALLGFLAVALGAFGAHGLQPLLVQHDTVEIWKTASHYHLVHAVVLLVLGLVAGEGNISRSSLRCFVFGLVLVGVTMFLLRVADAKWLYLMRLVIALLAIDMIVLVVVGCRESAGNRACVAWWCFVAGIAIFAGSLYFLAVTGAKWLGAITPFGGVYLLIGWLLLAIRRWPRAE